MLQYCRHNTCLKRVSTPQQTGHFPILNIFTMTTTPSREDAIKLDNSDVFRSKRDEFDLPDDVIYLCGNSLGPMPKTAAGKIEKTLQQDWATGLISSWNKAGWFMMTDTLGDRLGALLGADAGECVVSDATGINIYKTLHAALSMQPGRTTIVSEASSFPTDLYMIEGVASVIKDTQVLLEDKDATNIEALLDENTSVVLVNQVDYRSGEIRDIKSLTEKAHAVGALVISDLCHSAGAIPVDLHDDNVDFAVGCTYKYLNSGPGAPGFAYVASRHHGKFAQPVSGWHGHADPFKFELNYRKGNGARALLTGTQPVLSAVGVEAGLDVFEAVDIHALYNKGKQLSALFSELVDQWCVPYGIGYYSPRNVNKRNGQLSLTHENGYAVMQALIARNVIGDFRQPDVVRFGIAPLYLRYVDIWDAATQLKEVLHSEEWKQDCFNQQNLVT